MAAPLVLDEDDGVAVALVDALEVTPGVAGAVPDGDVEPELEAERAVDAEPEGVVDVVTDDVGVMDAVLLADGVMLGLAVPV